MDVATAFLNGELIEEVYMKQPEGFEIKGEEHLVCRLKRRIYGTKQSSKCWNSVLDERLKKMGFAQTNSDPCIYVATEGEMFVIAVHVDDIVFATKSDNYGRSQERSCGGVQSQEHGRAPSFHGW